MVTGNEVRRNIGSYIEHHKLIVESVAYSSLVAVSLFFFARYFDNSKLTVERPDITCSGLATSEQREALLLDLNTMKELQIPQPQRVDSIAQSCETYQEFEEYYRSQEVTP